MHLFVIIVLNPPSYICTISHVPNLYPTVLHKCILFSIAEYGGQPCSLHKIVVALKNLTHGLPRTWKRQYDPWRPDRGRPPGTEKCIVCKHKAAMGKAFSNQIVEQIRNCWVQIAEPRMRSDPTWMGHAHDGTRLFRLGARDVVCNFTCEPAPTGMG